MKVASFGDDEKDRLSNWPPKLLPVSQILMPSNQVQEIAAHSEQSKTSSRLPQTRAPTPHSPARPGYKSGLGSNSASLLPTPPNLGIVNSGPPMAARTGPSGGAGAYADCVDSLRSSLKFLEASVETIDRGVSDFPRMMGVLKTVRPTLAAAEASLRDEIGPYIAFLLSRADAQVERQERRIETLKARADLQQGRLARPDEPARKPASARSRQLRGEDKLRARIVRQRKEALRYGIERLELEVLQKERELKKTLG
ncbi:hypothetical protein TGAM01_v204910 [Trichoderma gamsii]|uniref:DASH complex subunit SPC19 n=1 Tax=Trichoderma gamsii TaxID=398673 RepID=A0A2P4ZQ84_9HYPO|nr:hypothetical protein TGAM01_v204910 [Trichoderma gamsii]PON26434.1 hypothetical protein TGAM01_v204910 [Trichoderma gamsii]